MPKIINTKFRKFPEPGVREIEDEDRVLEPGREADFLADLLGAPLASHMFQARIQPEQGNDTRKLADALLGLIADTEQDLYLILTALLNLVVIIKSKFHGIRLSEQAGENVEKIVEEAGAHVKKLKAQHIQQVHDAMTEGFPVLQAVLKTKGLTARQTDGGLLLSRAGKQPSAEDQQIVLDAVRTMVKEREAS